jgi:hypothetical protein
MLGAAVPPDCRVQRVQAVQRRAMLYNRPYRSQEEACLRAWLAPGGNASPADTSNGPLAEPAAAPAPRPAAAPALPWSPAPPDPRAAGSEGRGSVIVACRTVTYRAAPAGRRRLPAVPCSAVPCLCTMQRLTKTQTRRSKRPHDVGLREPPPRSRCLPPPAYDQEGAPKEKKKLQKNVLASPCNSQGRQLVLRAPHRARGVAHHSIKAGATVCVHRRVGRCQHKGGAVFRRRSGSARRHFG